jgi:hypothetical protein
VSLCGNDFALYHFPHCDDITIAPCISPHEFMSATWFRTNFFSPLLLLMCSVQDCSCDGISMSLLWIRDKILWCCLLQYTGLVISELLLLVPPMEQTGNRSGMHQKVLSTVDYSEACSWYQVTIRAALWSRLHDCCCGSVSSFAVYKWVLERIWNLTIHQGSSKCCCTEVSSLQSREWLTRPGCQWTNGRWLRKLVTFFGARW